MTETLTDTELDLVLAELWGACWPRMAHPAVAPAVLFGDTDPRDEIRARARYGMFRMAGGPTPLPPTGGPVQWPVHAIGTFLAWTLRSAWTKAGPAEQSDRVRDVQVALARITDSRAARQVAA